MRRSVSGTRARGSGRLRRPVRPVPLVRLVRLAGARGRGAAALRATGLALAVLAGAGCFVEAAPEREGTSAAPGADAPSVLLVSIDTLRADHVGAWGADFAATPTLDALAARGTRFATTLSPAPLTLPAHATLLTGLDPPRHGVRHNGLFRLDPAIPTLAARLSGRGWTTGAVVASSVLDRRFGLARGFGHWDDAIPSDPVRQSAAQRRADHVTAAARAWLDGIQPPFLLFVHYYDPHASYEPPPPFDERFAARPYDGEIAAVDAALATLLDDLAGRGWLAETIVAVTADHGESLGEHDEATHAYGIYDATQHVPWILAGPGVPAGRVVEGVARLADVAPTLLGLVGGPALPDPDGEDLSGVLAGTGPLPARTAYLESLAPEIDQGWSPLHGLRSGEELYVRAPRPELYRLPDDPGQRENLLPDPALAPRVAAHEAELAARLGAAVASHPVALDPATRRELEALGYALPADPVAPTERDPKDGRRSLARAHRAEVALAEGDAARAIRLLDELVAESPASATLHGRLGLAHAGAGDLEAAVRHTGRAVSLSPRSADLRLQLGTLHALRGDLAAAAGAFGEAAALEPELVAARLLWMAALAEAGEVERAAAQAGRALSLAPDDPAVARHVADAWERSGHSGRALAAYQRVLALAPGSARDHMHLAIHLARAGRDAEAERHLARAGAVRDDPRAVRMLAEARARSAAEAAEAAGPGGGAAAEATAP